VAATGSTCIDGSEAACEAGATATLAADETVLYCTPGPARTRGPAEPPCGEASCPTTYPSEFDSSGCESGGGATVSGDGSFTCSDGSEPGCSGGTTLTLSGGGTALVCEASATPAEPEASS
jgi:hypothetical protein